MIKRILALRYVCKKYGFKYHLKLFGDVGWVWPEERTMCVSLFQKNFYQTLYHEVGHIVADRSLGFGMKYSQASWESRLRFNGYFDAFVRLEEEAKASKFSMRVTKTSDRDFLKRFWYTYTGAVSSRMTSTELDLYTTTVAKYNKYFEDK